MYSNNDITNIRYKLDGVKTEWDIPFVFQDQNDLRVTVNTVTMNYGTDYSIKGTPLQGDAKLVLVDASTAGFILDITRDTQHERMTDFEQTAKFTAKDVDDEFDNVIRMIDDVDGEWNRRALHVREEDANINTELPPVPDASDFAMLTDASIDGVGFKFQKVPTEEYIDSEVDVLRVLATSSAASANQAAMDARKSYEAIGTITGEVNNIIPQVEALVAITNENVATTTADKNAAARSAIESDGGAQKALDSAETAHKWSDNPEGVPVESGKYSAYHWSKKAQQFAESASTGFELVGTWDASGGRLPPAPPSTAKTAPMYVISVAGTLPNPIGRVQVGNQLIYLLTTHSWEVVRVEGGVSSVNGQLGAVTLTATDVGAVSKTGNATISGGLTLGAGITLPSAKVENSSNSIMLSKSGVPSSDYSKIGILIGDPVVYSSGSGGYKKIYHEGYKPTAIDVKALPLTGGTLTGKLAANYVEITAPNSQLSIRNNTSGSPKWVIESSTDGKLRFTEGGEATQAIMDKTTGNLWLRGTLSTGGTLTTGGSISLPSSGIIVSDSGATYIRRSDLPDNNYRSIAITKDGYPSVHSKTYGYKKIFHEGFKPTASDVGTYTKAEIDSKVGGGWEEVYKGASKNEVYHNDPRPGVYTIQVRFSDNYSYTVTLLAPNGLSDKSDPFIYSSYYNSSSSKSGNVYWWRGNGLKFQSSNIHAGITAIYFQAL